MATTMPLRGSAEEQIANFTSQACQEVDAVNAEAERGTQKVCCRACSLTSQGLRCKGCKSPMRLRCLVANLCPGCAYGAEIPLEDDASQAVQTFEVRKLKQGQKTQLKAGICLAKTLQTNQLSPSTLSSILWAEAARGIHKKLAAVTRRSLKPLLVEWCCSDAGVLSTGLDYLIGTCRVQKLSDTSSLLCKNESRKDSRFSHGLPCLALVGVLGSS